MTTLTMERSGLSVSTASICGWCNTHGKPDHANCAVGVKYNGRQPHAKYPKGIVWACRCECNKDRRKCADCGNKNTDEVDPETWTCTDAEACRATVETRRANSPFLAQLREIQENVAMAKIENAEKATKTKVVKEGKCLVTGEPTKGGLFKPGMDARYVSDRVASVVDAGFTAKAEKEARGKMKSDGVSDKLIAKFDKSLGLAREKAEKRAAADKEKASAKSGKSGKSA